MIVGLMIEGKFGGVPTPPNFPSIISDDTGPAARSLLLDHARFA